MKWRVEITRERFDSYAMHLEWALMAQHAAAAARPVPIRVVLSMLVAAAGYMVGLVLIPTAPVPGLSLLGACTLAITLWGAALVSRAQSPARASARIQRQLARMRALWNRMLPVWREYDFHDGIVETTGKRLAIRWRSITAARAVVAVDVVALFRSSVSQQPWRMIFAPPRELLDELRRRGTDVIDVTDAPAGYREPLPVARQR